MDKKLKNKIIYIFSSVAIAMAIYRTYNYFQIKQENEELIVVSTPSISPIQFNKDTFDLELPDKDPFLESGWTPSEKTEISPSNNSEKNLNSEKKEVIKPVEKVWPKIEYFGFVKNRNKNNPLCLLKIDGEQIQLSKGQKHSGVLIVNTFRDSVLIVFEGSQKMVKKLN